MGHEVAIDLALRGWKVVILDYNEPAGKETARKIKGDFFKVDVRSWKEQYEAFQIAFEKYKRVDFGQSCFQVGQQEKHCNLLTIACY